MGNIVDSVNSFRSNTESHPIREQRTIVVDRSNQEYILNGNTESRYLPTGQFYSQERKFINIKKSRAIQNLCHINGRAVSYYPVENKLVFEYDCIENSVLKIYNNETSTLDENAILSANPVYEKKISKSLQEISTLYLRDVCLSKEFVLEIKPINAERDQYKTQNSLRSSYKDNSDSKYRDPSNSHSHLRDVNNENNLDSSYTSQLTFCRQLFEAGLNNGLDNKVEIRRQCVIYKGKAFDIQSVYGLSSKSDNSKVSEDRKSNRDDNESESCVVCLTNNRETILLPCRHACLCSECSKILLKNAHDCPICRNQIHSIVNIESNK